MDEVNKHELNWKAYVWRGTLGGVIGNVILELLGTMYLVVRFGANYLHDGLIIGLVSALIGGAIIGLAVGFVIYKVTQRWGKQPKVLCAWR